MIKLQILRIVSFTLLYIFGILMIYGAYDSNSVTKELILNLMIASLSIFSLLLAIDSSVHMKLANSREMKFHFRNIRNYSIIVLISSLILLIIVQMF
jgi:hypothetical protein